MKTILDTLETIGRFSLNKAVAIFFTLVLLKFYHNLPTDRPVPYAELIYLAILILGTSVIGPFLRLLIFPEAAFYAESGKLKTDISTPGLTPGLIHYWFATFISFATAIACSASLAH